MRKPDSLGNCEIVLFTKRWNCSFPQYYVLLSYFAGLAHVVARHYDIIVFPPVISLFRYNMYYNNSLVITTLRSGHLPTYYSVQYCFIFFWKLFPLRRVSVWFHLPYWKNSIFPTIILRPIFKFVASKHALHYTDKNIEISNHIILKLILKWCRTTRGETQVQIDIRQYIYIITRWLLANF